jgi:tRNA A-37 threonylcarbamoyl transferase component Bud32
MDTTEMSPLVKPGRISIPAGSLLARQIRYGTLWGSMRDVKDTQRALVRVSYDGRVFKTFRGPKAGERFANEVRVLRHLEAAGCPFVPRLLEASPEELRIVTTNCGSRVEHLDDARRKEIFAELEKYGVLHDDPDMRNVTYRQSDGRFCLIDFEFATILPESEKPADAARQ